MRQLTGGVLLVAGAFLLSACGDDEEAETRTVVQTVTAPAPGGQTTTTTPGASTTEPAGPALPDGLIAADGSYEVKFRDIANEGQEQLGVRDADPGPDWKFATSCEGSRCSVELRRGLPGGGSKTILLTAVEGRPNVYEGSSSSTHKCLTGDKQTVSKRQRYSIKPKSPIDRQGRQTARKIDIYLIQTTNQCEEDGRTVLSFSSTLKE